MRFVAAVLSAGILLASVPVASRADTASPPACGGTSDTPPSTHLVPGAPQPTAPPALRQGSSVQGAIVAGDTGAQRLSRAPRPVPSPAGGNAAEVPQRLAYNFTYIKGDCFARKLETPDSQSRATLVVLGDDTPDVRVFYHVAGEPHAPTPPGGAVDALPTKDDHIELVATDDRGNVVFDVRSTPIGVCVESKDGKLAESPRCAVSSVSLRPDGWDGVLSYSITKLLTPPVRGATLKTAPRNTWTYDVRVHRAGGQVASFGPLPAPGASAASPLTVAIVNVYDLHATDYGVEPTFINDAVSSGLPAATHRGRYGVDSNTALNLRLRASAAFGLRSTDQASVNAAASTLLNEKADPGDGFNSTDSDALQFGLFSKLVAKPLSDTIANNGGDLRYFLLGNIPQTDAGLKVALRDKNDAGTMSFGAIGYRSTGDKNVPDATDSTFQLSSTSTVGDGKFGVVLTNTIASRTAQRTQVSGPFAPAATLPGMPSAVAAPLASPVPQTFHGSTVGAQFSYQNSKLNLGTLIRLGETTLNGAARDTFIAQTWHSKHDGSLVGGALRGSATDVAAGWRETDPNFQTQLGDAMGLRGTRGPWYAVSQSWTSNRLGPSRELTAGFGQNRWFSDFGVEQFTSTANLGYSIDFGTFQYTYQLSGTRSDASRRLLAQQLDDINFPLGVPTRDRVDHANFSVGYKDKNNSVSLGVASQNDAQCAKLDPAPAVAPATPGPKTITCVASRTHGTVTATGSTKLGDLTLAAGYGTAVRESGSPLIAARKLVLGSLRYDFKCGSNLKIDAINRAGFDGLKDLAGSEYDATLLMHVSAKGPLTNFGIQIGYSFVNSLNILGKPTLSHQFSVQIPNLFNARSDSAPKC
jgi:hypothetical protein